MDARPVEPAAAGPEVAWRTLQGRRWLRCTFQGELGAEDGRESARRFGALLDAAVEPVMVIWDCSEMTGYDREAREAWQAEVSRHRDRIGRIHVVSPSAAVRLGATAISLITGLPVARWTRLDEIVCD